jgi:hypothetical protein
MWQSSAETFEFDRPNKYTVIIVICPLGGLTWKSPEQEAETPFLRHSDLQIQSSMTVD